MTLGFSRLLVRGFRRLQSLDLELGPLNVLIGANGVGKTSILDVFSLLGSSAAGNLESALNSSGGLSSLLTADGKTTLTTWAIETPPQQDGALEYRLTLASQGYGYTISEETLTQQRDPSSPSPFIYIQAAGARVVYHFGGRFVQPDWKYDWRETALSQIPKMYREGETFRNSLADVAGVYRPLDVSQRAVIRMPQTLAPAETPGRDGGELLSCLYTLRELHPERYSAVEDALRSAFPTFVRLEFPPQAGGLLTLGWRDANFIRPISAIELSEGTLRFIWLATLLQSPGLSQVTLIDEPEVSLHPDLLRLTVELLREASERTQLIVATHSDRLVTFLDSSELVVCDLDENGCMLARRVDGVDIDAWLEDYTLGQLWSLGRLGAKP